MAGIPKRRSGERRHSYNNRCVDAELTRRDEKAIALLDKIEHDLREAHRKTMDAIRTELVRYYRAEPGTKYDITARKGKR